LLFEALFQFGPPDLPSLPVAQEKWLRWKLPDAPGGYGQAPVDVRVVRVRRVIWHKVGWGAGEAVAVRLGTRACFTGVEPRVPPEGMRRELGST